MRHDRHSQINREAESEIIEPAAVAGKGYLRDRSFIKTGSSERDNEAFIKDDDQKYTTMKVL